MIQEMTGKPLGDASLERLSCAIDALIDVDGEKMRGGGVG